MSTTTDLYRYPYGAPDLETEAASQRRIDLERQIDQDLRAHIEDELCCSRIVNGKLEPCRYSELLPEERRAAEARMNGLYC